MAGSHQKYVIMEEFTKTDLILLMQVLNKAHDKSPLGHSYRFKLPLIMEKVDNRLLQLIKEQKTDV